MNSKPAKNALPRRKFLSWFGIVSAVAASGSVFAFNNTSKKKGKTVRMLTQEGKLVEVDESMIQNKRTRITDEELQNWIKRK